MEGLVCSGGYGWVLLIGSMHACMVLCLCCPFLPSLHAMHILDSRGSPPFRPCIPKPQLLEGVSQGHRHPDCWSSEAITQTETQPTKPLPSLIANASIPPSRSSRSTPSRPSSLQPLPCSRSGPRSRPPALAARPGRAARRLATTMAGTPLCNAVCGVVHGEVAASSPEREGGGRGPLGRAAVH